MERPGTPADNPHPHPTPLSGSLPRMPKPSPTNEHRRIEAELSMDESIRLDLRYVENWSLIGDVTIVMKTVGVVLRPGGAY